MHLPALPRPRSLAGQLFAMQAVLIAVVVAGYALFTYVSDRRQAEESAARQATAVARSVADAPSVRAAIREPDPAARLEPYALQVTRDANVDFVTIMDPSGIRWTHPDRAQIGRRFLGTIGPARQGRTFTETYTGTLGPSVRAVTPVTDGGRVIGLVSAGIKVETISARIQDQVAALLGVAGGALVLGAVGTYVINARLRRHTHNMNATELSRMHDYHQAALHAVREGLLMLDGQYRVALVNDGGRELLGLGGTPDADLIGRSVAGLGLPAPLTGALLSAEPRVDEVHLTASRVLVVNTSPVSGGERRGTVVTLRDVTELQSLMGELDSERGFTQALRSQAHEAANRLHTVVSLIELGRAEEAVEFATAELELAQALTDQVVAAVSEPVLAALLLGKTAQAHERGVELVVSPDSRLDDGLLPAELPARDLVTILGNLIDNAVDAAQGSVRARVTVTAYASGAELVLRVSDTGPGVDPAHAGLVFQRGFSTKPAGPGGRGLGLALARQAVTRHEGTLTVTGPGEDGEDGAVFEVRLPLRASRGDGRCASPGGGSASTGDRSVSLGGGGHTPSGDGSASPGGGGHASLGGGTASLDDGEHSPRGRGRAPAGGGCASPGGARTSAGNGSASPDGNGSASPGGDGHASPGHGSASTGDRSISLGGGGHTPSGDGSASPGGGHSSLGCGTASPSDGGRLGGGG
ncbi:ATP-binding protein [Streptomyces rubradiris]